MTMLISIVIPVYNTEKYIKKCLDSIRKQTIDFWECILVDDCSTDNTFNIIKEYQQKDSRFKIFQNEKNLGCGLTRRKAISLGKGDWFSFIDSDDYVNPTFLEDMLNACINTNSDISVCGTVDVSNKYIINNISKINNQFIYTDKEKLYYDYLWSDKVRQYNGNKLYKKYIIDKIEYSPLRFCEDSATTYKWLMEANKVVIIPKAHYYYVHHLDSNSNKNNDRLRKSIDTSKCIYEHWIFCNKNKYTTALNWLKKFVYPHVIYALFKLDFNSNEYKEVEFIANEMNI